MLISHIDLLTSVPGLQVLSGMKLPVKVAFAVSRVGKRVEDALNDFNKVRAALVDQYADRDEAGNIVEAAPGMAMFTDDAAFTADFKALQEIEVDIPFTPISIEDLGEVQIEPQVLRAVAWLIV